MNALVSPDVIGRGLFPLPEAARLAQLDVRTARRWVNGDTFRYRGETRESAGLMSLALEPARHEQDLTFPEMLTLRLVRGFRSAGLGLRTIKRVARIAARDYGIDLPFVSKRFRTDGRKVFLELQAETATPDEPALPGRERRLVEVLTGQDNFVEVVEPSLFANVEWQDDLVARWWPLARDRHVVLDPQAMFGAPHLKGTSVPTGIVAAAVHAEGGGPAALAAVADWYGITIDAVQDAVRFETEWLKKAA